MVAKFGRRKLLSFCCLDTTFSIVGILKNLLNIDLIQTCFAGSTTLFSDTIGWRIINKNTLEIVVWRQQKDNTFLLPNLAIIYWMFYQNNLLFLGRTQFLSNSIGWHNIKSYNWKWCRRCMKKLFLMVVDFNLLSTHCSS